MYAATAFHHSYEDAGVFCIQASAHPSKMTDCVSVITQEFVRLTHGTDEVGTGFALQCLFNSMGVELNFKLSETVGLKTN